MNDPRLPPFTKCVYTRCTFGECDPHVARNNRSLQTHTPTRAAHYIYNLLIIIRPPTHMSLPPTPFYSSSPHPPPQWLFIDKPLTVQTQRSHAFSSQPIEILRALLLRSLYSKGERVIVVYPSYHNTPIIQCLGSFLYNL